MDSLETLRALGAALAVGLLVGTERGWRDRELAEGGRVAGLRTFALVGLMGGVAAMLSVWAGPWALAVALAGLAALLAVSYAAGAKVSGSVSVTTAVAAMLTLALGALAAQGEAVAAIATAVVVALLLDLKPVLHRWLRLVEPRELTAVLQLLVLSLVILPVLPDRGFGPFDAVNPYRLWWAVVLVASLSLVGHVAMRLSGPQRGLLLSGLLGGLASSTAATVALARRGRPHPDAAATLSAAILAACGVMFVRMAVLVAALQPALLARLGGILVVMALASFAAAAWHWRRHASEEAPDGAASTEGSLFDLRSALAFGALLAAVAVFTRAANDALGAAGLYGLAALSGLADVDAIVISLMRMNADGELAASATALAAVIAAASNLVMKAGIAWTLGSRAIGIRVAASFGIVALTGSVAALVTSAL
ncbi:MgtC/SapB family protein [Roseateles saccharophilus]|uniref:Uncharacterized membrane protein (DUF4010 family) n=1 Tax=Roseateles saccharophilus TaxID=304 RepID=A0A4R3UUK0_ROSSA|nr:MgtC/SapB family protein [Roseateles saccharophilus]MDG0833183.1 MgtC/SapB family protein [Roseateles saccharophilus]TCU94651.1 uncharacterized membrane protein (DUF4010 family) [Roseateles saccharophilus]